MIFSSIPLKVLYYKLTEPGKKELYYLNRARGYSVQSALMVERRSTQTIDRLVEIGVNAGMEELRRIQKMSYEEIQEYVKSSSY